jgi:type VI protein secretion system component Hcp
MASKNPPGKKNRRSTSSVKVIKDLPPRSLGDEARRQVKGGAVAFKDITITKPIDKSTPKL